MEGSTLLRKYGNSLHLLLSSVFPEHHWDPSSRKKVPSNWWKQEANQLKFVESFAKQHKLERLEEWYSITPTFFTATPAGMLKHFIYC